MVITVVQETEEWIWLTYTEPPGCIGYVYLVNGMRVSNTWNPSPPKQPIKFSKPHPTGDVFEVLAVGSVDHAQVTGGGIVQPPPPPPPSNKLVAIYDNDSNKAADWPALAALGVTHLICGADDTASLKELKATGGKAWCTVGYWDDPNGAFSHTDSEALAIAKAALANYPGVVEGWYLADEPSMKYSDAPALLSARGKLLKSVISVPTYIAMWDDSIFTQFMNSADVYAIDGYPNRDNFNMSDITSRAAAADVRKIPYVGVLGAFTDGGVYKLPTAAQLKTMADTWKATNEIGVAIYEYGPAGGANSTWLQNRPELLAVLKSEYGMSASDVLAVL